MIHREINTKIGFIILAVIFIACSTILIFIATQGDYKFNFEDTAIGKKIVLNTSPSKLVEIKKFTSTEEFKKFILEHADSNAGYGLGGGMMRNEGIVLAPDMGVSMEKGSAGQVTDSSLVAQRISETNMQVAGIDEPDIVKTDGKEIYYSMFGGYSPFMRISPMVEDRSIMPPSYLKGETKLISAFPLETMKIDAKIDKNGELLLAGNILMVLGADNKIYAYDVKEKASPKEVWVAKLNDRENIIGARLMNNKLYLTTRSSINRSMPCPIKPLTVGKEEVSIACNDIYYPVAAASADATYNFMVLETQTGTVEQKSAFVGSAGQTVFYMSENAFYLTYQTEFDSIKVAYDFFMENKDLVPSWVLEKLNKIRGYDLSVNSKQAELQSILEQYRNSLNNDDLLKLDNEINNRMEAFYLKYRREMDLTGIAKINLKDFSAFAGIVPGHPLNQFSLDEYNGNLRIATTIGGRWWGLGNFGSNNKTVSDIYVLNEKMTIIGSVKGLGETERIYSVRFIADRGYVVTFREIDPFYVLNLANPTNPVLRGELKIPGYSSYLHPIGENKVLGLGREDGKVKLSIFDASTPENPKEVSKYSLNEYWSEALDNHRAFLLDDKHKIFFIPGSQGGYIFSYAKDTLILKKAVSDIQAERAIYLDDYLYLLGKNKIVVLDEKNWEKVKEFDL
jgi:inhibitor of cysteine peptidase